MYEHIEISVLHSFRREPDASQRAADRLHCTSSEYPEDRIHWTLTVNKTLQSLICIHDADIGHNSIDAAHVLISHRGRSSLVSLRIFSCHT